MTSRTQEVTAAVIIAIVVIGAISWERRPQQPKQGLLVESPRPVSGRAYINTAEGDHFFLVDDKGNLCRVDADIYLATLLGEQVECLWKEQP